MMEFNLTPLQKLVWYHLPNSNCLLLAHLRRWVLYTLQLAFHFPLPCRVKYNLPTFPYLVPTQFPSLFSPFLQRHSSPLLSTKLTACIPHLYYWVKPPWRGATPFFSLFETTHLQVQYQETLSALSKIYQSPRTPASYITHALLNANCSLMVTLLVLWYQQTP